MPIRFFRALLYPFEDPAWPRKLGLALLAAAVPVLGFFVIKGWEFETSAAVRRRDPRPLADWGNLGSKLWRGLQIRAAGILYNIPTYALVLLGILTWVGLFMRFLRGEALTLDAFADLFQRTLVPRLALLLLTLIYALLANSLYWAGYIRYIETGRFATFFEVFRNAVVVFRTLLDDILTAIYLGLVSLLAGLIGMLLTALLGATGVGAVVLPVLIPSITLTLLSSFSGHLFGQLAAHTLDR